MEILDIQLFCDLVELKSYSKAADRNHLTQSAVSQRISALNNRYENMLFKNKSKVLLSPKGQEIYERFRDILNIYNYTTRLAVNKSHRASISAAFCDNAQNRIVNLDLMNEFIRSEFFLDIGYSYSQTIYEQVHWGVIDYGIIGHKPEPCKGLECLPLYMEEIALLTCRFKLSHDTKLSDVPLLMDSKLSGLYLHIMDMLHDRGLNVEELNVVANIGTSKDKPPLLRQRNFCSFLPISMLGSEPGMYELEMGLRSKRVFYEVFLSKNASKIEPIRSAISAHNTWLNDSK